MEYTDKEYCLEVWGANGLLYPPRTQSGTRKL